MDSLVALKERALGSWFEAEAPLLRESCTGDIAHSAPAAWSAFPVDRRLSWLRRYGSFTLAYSAAFQEGLEYFGGDHGFLAYKMVGRTALVLADPLTSPENRKGLIREFVQANADVYFCQVSRPTAEVLAGMGFKVNEMGTDHRIALTNYKRKTLRTAARRTANDGYVIRECAAASVGFADIKNVSEGWRQTRTYKRREVGFLNRPIVLDDEVDVRKFFAFDRDGKLVAFSFYDPIYEDGRVVGYSTSFKRRLPEADPSICSAILQSAIDAFQQEKRNWLFLGLSPMADIEDKEFHHDSFLSFAFRHAFRSRLFNRFVYPLQGHASHKRDFRGVAEQTYFAFKGRTGPAFPRVLKLLRACNMI
jgi:phosphatidylglycerol lysyltransferase